MKKAIQFAVLIFLFAGFLNASAQFNGHHTYMAQLKAEYAPVDVMVGEYVLFTIHPEEVFIYDTFGKQAWLANGNFGRIEEERVEKLDKQHYFKFNHSPEFFKLEEGHEILLACDPKGIDYPQLVTNAIGGSTADLEQLFLLMNVLTGTAGELHKSMMWKVFNRWDDKSFSEFFNSLQEDIQKEIGKFLYKSSTIWPIEDHTSYFNEYYPKTLQLIMKYKDL
jgi:hypothetical protein